MSSNPKPAPSPSATEKPKAYGPPEFIMKQIESMPLLPHETMAAFLDIYDCFLMDLEPQNLRDHYQIYDLSVLVFEVFRYRYLKGSIIKNEQRGAAEQLYRETHTGVRMPGAYPQVAAIASQEAAKWAADPFVRQQAATDFQKAGFTDDAVSTISYLARLPELARIEAMIASTEKRLAIYLKQLVERNDARVARIRRATERALTASSPVTKA